MEHTALLVLLALIPLRAVVGETHTFEVARSLRTLDAPAGASPATTFAINALIFAVAGLVLTLKLWFGEGYRRTGAEWGAAILAVAMGISTYRAGQKHLAIIGSIDFLGLLVYFITLSQLLRRPWQVRLALTVILTTGAVMITKCAYQRYIEWPDTVQYYNDHKAELISANDSNPGFIYDYEQRLKGGSVTGFFSHPNVLASYLILVILTAFGVARSRWGRGRMWTVLIPGIIGVAGVATLTGAQSKGAAAALGIALVAWMIGEWKHKFFRGRPLRSVHTIWACLFALALMLTLILHFKPDALGLSMLYRSYYWRASVAMIRDQGPWGVGAENFGRHFTRYKDVECPEDVEDPHSWVVRAAAEWGVLGLIGLVAVLVGISRRIANNAKAEGVAQANSLCESNSQSSATWLELPEGAIHASSIILSSAFIGILLFAGWLVTLVDAPPPYIVLTLFIPAVTWFLAFFLTAYEPASGKSISDAPLGPMLAALSAGLLGFVIHSGIDLALFNGGAVTTFFALITVGLASRVRCADQERAMTPLPRANLRYAVPAACIVLVLCLFMLYVKASLASQGIASARRAPANQPLDKYGWPQSTHNYYKAVAAYHSDSTALEEFIDVCIPFVATTYLADELLNNVDDFAERDPHNALVHHYRAIVNSRRFDLEHPGWPSTQALEHGTPLPPYVACLDWNLPALDSARLALAAHPTSPQRHIFLADLTERYAALPSQSEDRKRALIDAASELQTALDLDAKRIYVSPLHRMTKEMRVAIEQRIARLKPPPTR